MADTNTRRRVKLYMLNEAKQWEDKGTGYVSSIYVEKFRGMSLLVRSEDDGSVLLESKIQPHTPYQKQQETLIVWSEADTCDLALSFQEKAGCDEIWEKICQVQGKDPTLSITQEVMEQLEGDSIHMDDENVDDLRLNDPIDMTLPPCELSKLDEISEFFSLTLHTPTKRDHLALLIENENYIKRLIDLFHICEDLENTDGLHRLYEIFKSIFLLNKTPLFEIMFADDTIFDVVGIMEYDPSASDPVKHREYLRTQAHFKEVIPIANTDVLQKIHQTYRVQYIQDVILPTPSVFEENMLSTLSSFIFFNKLEIVSNLQEDEKFLSALFATLTDEDTSEERRRDCALFLKEFCAFSQTLQPPNRESFFKVLTNLGILRGIELVLGLEDEQVKSAFIDIFSHVVEFSPSMVREYVLQESQRQDDDDLLINLVIEQMVTDPDPELGGAMQLMGIIRLLIDPENMLSSANTPATVRNLRDFVQKTEKSEFLTFFYKHCMHKLTAPLLAITAEDKPSKDDYKTAQLLSIILELLTFCIEHHTYHCRNYVVSKDLLRRVLVLLKSKHGFLALASLRLFRRTVGLKDDFYNRYITNGSLFKQITDAFVANGNKYNLFNSALIELFEFIRADDIRTLTKHIVECHIKAFEGVEYVDVFKNLKLRFDQYQDQLQERSSLDSMQSLVRNNRFRRDARSLEEEEEIWFDQDEDYEEPDSMPPMTDMLRTKIDTDFDQINRYLERNRSPGIREHDFRESPPRFFNRSPNSINFNISRSPPSNSPSPTPTPACSPNSSPITSPKSPSAAVENKPTITPKSTGLVGLVDYDEDSDEEEEEDEEEEDFPMTKRARILS